jgi:glycolate oxidase
MSAMCGEHQGGRLTRMADARVLVELAAGLADGALVTDADVVGSHRRDQAPFCPAGDPLALVRARRVEDVEHVLRVAHEHRVPVVPQGARTGLSGGANAVDGAILLSLERMNRILEIDPVEGLAVVEAGVVNAELSRAVAARGLYYPPDPSSWESSTIGGNVATNAGGLCCVKYGVTGDFVRGLRVVLPGGQRLWTGRRTAKGVAGYDLTHLFVGSEGTLGVVTEVTVRLLPAPPPAGTAVATFDSVVDAVEVVVAVMGRGWRPSLLELLDEPTIRAINDYRAAGLEDVAAMLLVQSDRGELAARDVAEFAAICRSHGAREVIEAADEAEAALLLDFRRAVMPATERLGAMLIDDVCVPRGRLADLVTGVADISRQHGLLITCPGHAGDGNMHPTVVFDAADPGQVRRAEAAFDAVMALGLALGGTITGEHGVGLLKRRWLGQEVGPLATELHHRLKLAFDPHGILNPGKVIPPVDLVSDVTSVSTSSASAGHTGSARG